MAVSKKSARRQLASRGKRQFHSWNWGGKSVIRIFTWAHVWNDWDLKWGRCEEEDVGQEEDHFFLKHVRAWRSKGGKNVWTNCLPHKDPFWEEWNALSEKEQDEHWKLKPGSRVYFNAFDEDYPQGVQILDLTVPQFMGMRPSKHRRETYGVYHMWDGYDPEEIKKEEQEVDEETEEAGASPDSRGGLKKRAGKGDAMFGPKGQDILLFFGKTSKIGYSTKTKGGPVQMRLQKNCKHLTPEEFYLGQVQDLFLIDDFIPGFASDGHHISPDVVEFQAWREGRPAKVQIVGAALEEGEEEPEDVQPEEETEEAEEVEQPVEEETEEVDAGEETEEAGEESAEEAEEAEESVRETQVGTETIDGDAYDEAEGAYVEPDQPPKKKKTRRVMKQGTLVKVTDDGIVYNGTFERSKGADLEKGQVQVTIRVGDQETDKARETFRKMLAAAQNKEPSEITDDDMTPVVVKRNQVQFAD